MYIERFKGEDVDDAFAYLFNQLGVLLDEVNFMQLKRACLQRGSLLPFDFKQQIKAAIILDDLLDVLGNPMYCNWLNIHLLKRIVKSIDIPEAKYLIQAYEECVYSRKVSDVTSYFRSDYFKPSHVSLITTRINQSSKNLTVADIIRYYQELESDMEVNAGSVSATGISLENQVDDDLVSYLIHSLMVITAPNDNKLYVFDTLHHINKCLALV